MTTTPDSQPAMARITCGCGFEVVGADEELNAEAFAGHSCPNDPPAPARPWYAHLFSVWGWAIFATVAYAIAAILHAKAW